jgi:hypothetical protein
LNTVNMNTKQSGYFKIGLVVVLALAFVAALGNSVMKISRSSPPPLPSPRASAAVPQPEPAHAVSQPAAPLVATPTPSAALPGTPSKRTWPRFELAEIIAFDPFSNGKPVESLSAIKTAGQNAAEGKQVGRGNTESGKGGSTKGDADFNGRIHAVYQRGGHTAALVGAKTVRPGDQLEGAGRVVEVDQGGMMLEVRK